MVIYDPIYGAVQECNTRNGRSVLMSLDCARPSTYCCFPEDGPAMPLHPSTSANGRLECGWEEMVVGPSKGFQFPAAAYHLDLTSVGLPNNHYTGWLRSIIYLRYVISFTTRVMDHLRRLQIGLLSLVGMFQFSTLGLFWVCPHTRCDRRLPSSQICFDLLSLCAS